MCTAVTYKTKDHYFGRNLDLECSLGEAVTITPRNYSFSFRCEKPMLRHYAMVGIAITENGYPLYYDAVNEMGLGMAGLNFPGNAVYHDPQPQKFNVTPFEFIPWILGQCKNLADAKQLLQKVNLVNIPFNEKYPLSPLHWIIADKENAIVVESVASGLNVYENPVGILTNNPPFDYHMHHLANYLNLTSEEPDNRFSDKVDLRPYSRGMGAMGLPGDLSSSSRFIKAAFTKLNSISEETESASISQFFHILNSVAQQKGCVQVGELYEITVYSSCCNTDKGIYYYTTYENSQITGIDMNQEDLDEKALISYPLIRTQQLRMVN